MKTLSCLWCLEQPGKCGRQPGDDTTVESGLGWQERGRCWSHVGRQVQASIHQEYHRTTGRQEQCEEAAALAQQLGTQSFRE